MKTNILKCSLFLGLLVFFIACSTKKNNFVSRNSHALSTKYNILYNGGIALETGINELKGTYKDNFWERLPVERMQPLPETNAPATDKPAVKNANFERAETKAIKAIQKHSMNIGGSEKNPQMDEAHLMLGKARYYDQRFVPALEAFNYVLYKYPKSDKIYEVKIWREKTNMRMENDALAVNNLRKLLHEIKFKDQVFADANATLAQAFLNMEEKDSAVAKLKLAVEFTKESEEKARYRFILAQLYEELGHKDSAYASYQEVIDMNRSSPRQYVIQAHAKQALQFDFEKGDTIAFLKKYEKLLEDRENRPYLDVLNHQVALFYDKYKNFNQAKKYYNKSLDANSQDAYLVASNYRNLADLYFNKARYVTAGQYYDSTLVQLKPRSREFNLIKKKRDNLNDVIKYEGIAQRNDSILRVVAMKDPERISYYEDYIAKLKKEDEIKKALQEKERERAEKAAKDGKSLSGDDEASEATASRKNTSRAAKIPPTSGAPVTSAQGGDFYFYNSATVAYGKAEFKKSWGDRSYKENWRLSSVKTSTPDPEEDGNDTASADESAKKDAAVNPRYTTEFYIRQLPTKRTEIDSLAKERNFAYYQLGAIYKEKFKEYRLAADKLEKLLQNEPEERLILPSLYNLYKIYEIIDKDKALAMKNQIIRDYPDSRYAQILNNSDPENVASLTPEAAYIKLFKLYESGDYRKVLAESDIAIDQFTGEEMLSKFELLKANTIGKLKGIEEYKKALNYVSLTYPNNEEGKEAEALLGSNIPWLEKLDFNDTEPKSWKILYRSANAEDKATKALQEKIKKFITERTADQLSQSYDIYTMDANFIVIHGIKTEEGAKGIASVLKEFKEYKVAEVPIVISNDNYSVVQIKKNLDEYLADPKKVSPPRAPLSVKAAPAPEKTDVPRGARIPKNKPEQPAQGQPQSNPGKKPPGIAAPPQDNDQAPKQPQKR